MIRKVGFLNFKGLRDVLLELEQLTVLVGPNASGKTSILKGLFYLSGSRTPESEKIYSDVQDPSLLVSRNATEPMELAMEGDDGGLKLRFLVPDRVRQGVTFTVSKGEKAFWHVEAFSRKNTLEIKGTWQLLTQPESGMTNLPSAVFLRFEVDRLAAPSYSEEPSPTIKQNGDNLASVLAFLALNHPEKFSEIKKFLKMIIPTFRNIRFNREPLNYEFFERYEEPDHSWSRPRRTTRRVMGDSLVLDFEGAPGIPASMVSEGTILVLGLITVLMDPNCPQLILLDDVDRGIHPKAQRDLVEFLRVFLKSNPQAQIVATTHSPYLLDNLKAEEVRLTTLAPDGSVVCGRLDEHPDFEQWKDAMRPGEFWSMVGEKWVGEVRAAESV